jgi:UDP-glucose 4-epimerase
VVDDLSSGHASNLEHHAGTPGLDVQRRDLRQVPARDAIFRDATYVFHFAGKGDIVPSIEQPHEYMSVNVMGTVAALEGARWAGVRKFVYAASSSCYGLADELPTTETAPIRAEYPYALSKYLGEQATFHWAKVYRLPALSLRMFNVYGPRSRTTGAYGAVFGVFLAQKLAGTPFTVVGDGTQTRDFVFVTDVARAFLAGAESDQTGEIYTPVGESARGAARGRRRSPAAAAG